MSETRHCPGVGFYRLRPASGEGMEWVGEVYNRGDGMLLCRHHAINQQRRKATGDSITGCPVDKMGARWLWEPVERPKWP